jgi:glutamyl-tRNA synthetase
MSDKKVITRFAPSPTGFMHVGGVRTALFAWLWARKNKGEFILRIEDTDKAREVLGSVSHIIESLKWLGLDWDQGPDIGGSHTPYLQSERLDIYKKYAQILIDKGFAYPDPYKEEEVAEFRNKAISEKKPFLFREHRPDFFDVWDGTKPLRFKVPNIKSYKWYDMVRGDLSAGAEALDDFILIKADGYPTYNFAHIVDDIEMEVTHVMRGEEFISSTPKFLSVYEALEIKPPFFATLPPILGDGGNKKLSKRDGAKDVLDYKKEGYLPSAMLNFLAMLGWNPGDDREVMSVSELIESFDIEKVQKSGAQWNTDKLDWLNREHILSLPRDIQSKYILDFLPEKIKNLPNFSNESFSKIIPLINERISKFEDVKNMADAGELDYFFSDPIYKKEEVIWKQESAENTRKYLDELVLILDKVSSDEFNDKDFIKDSIWGYAESVGRGNVLWPMRFALSGKEKSPDPFALASILGKDKTLKRLKDAVQKLS